MTKDSIADLDLVNQQELAKILRVSEAWLERQRWKNQGIPYIKIGSKVFYDRQDIAAWIEKRKSKKNNTKTT